MAVHEPDLADPTSESQQWTFDQGTEVGRLAQGLFPGGMEVTEGYKHLAEAVETTKRLLEQGASTLYEPAFVFNSVLVRADILTAVDGGWDVYEVKSSGELKPQHVTDAAVQTYVIEGAGLPVRRSYVVHLNKEYEYLGGQHDAGALFAVEDVTEAVRAYLPAIPDQLAIFQGMLERDEPRRLIGTQCRNPYPCSFTRHCHAFLPDRYPVTDIPRISQKALHALLADGVTCILDIPDGCDFLTAKQVDAMLVVKRGEPFVDTDGLAAEFEKLTFPLYHLDFEAANPALPIWPRSRPYEVIPFQYSIHVEHEDGTLEHREYLQTDGSDPRRALAEQLLADLGESGSVVHYTNYELKILAGLAERLPDLAEPVAKVVGRLFDLEPVVKEFARHPEACGRTSIKYALPAWCPELSYKDMNIGDGMTAATRYVKAVRRLVDEATAQQTFRDLLDYCELDTLAMVRLYDTLRQLI